MRNGEIKNWITMKGNKVPILKGQTKKEAVKEFIDSHSDSKIEKYKKLSTKELKDKLKIDYGKFVKNGETTELIPEDKDGVYRGSDKYPRTIGVYKYEKTEKPEELKTIDEIYGEEYKGYKGKDAIDKVLHEKSGHVKNAFYKPEVGNVDIIWGTENIGLKHLIKDRLKESKERMHETISMLAETIEKSTFDEYRENPGSYRFVYMKGKKRYSVVIAPSYHGKKATYVLTGFFRP
jgi:hypothetical protein